METKNLEGETRQAFEKSHGKGLYLNLDIQLCNHIYYCTFITDMCVLHFSCLLIFMQNFISAIIESLKKSLESLVTLGMIFYVSLLWIGPLGYQP